MRTRIICWILWYLIVLCLSGCLVHEDIDSMHRSNNNWWSDLDTIHPVQGHAIQWFTQCWSCSFWIVKLKGWHFSKQVEYPTLPGPFFCSLEAPMASTGFLEFWRCCTSSGTSNERYDTWGYGEIVWDYHEPILLTCVVPTFIWRVPGNDNPSNYLSTAGARSWRSESALQKRIQTLVPHRPWHPIESFTLEQYIPLAPFFRYFQRKGMKSFLKGYETLPCSFPSVLQCYWLAWEL